MVSEGSLGVLRNFQRKEREGRPVDVILRRKQACWIRLRSAPGSPWSCSEGLLLANPMAVGAFIRAEA